MTYTMRPFLFSILFTFLATVFAQPLQPSSTPTSFPIDSNAPQRSSPQTPPATSFPADSNAPQQPSPQYQNVWFFCLEWGLVLLNLIVNICICALFWIIERSRKCGHWTIIIVMCTILFEDRDVWPRVLKMYATFVWYGWFIIVVCIYHAC